MPSPGLCRVRCGLACRVWESRPNARHNHSPFCEETSLSTTIWRGADHERQGDAWCGWSGRWPGMQTDSGDTGAEEIHAELGGRPGAVDGACEFLQTRRAARVPGVTVIMLSAWALILHPAGQIRGELGIIRHSALWVLCRVRHNTHRTTERLRTSRSIRSSAFSLRSRFSSAMSSTERPLVPSRSPRSLANQLPSVPSLIPRSRAT